MQRAVLQPSAFQFVPVLCDAAMGSLSTSSFLGESSGVAKSHGDCVETLGALPAARSS